MASKLSHYALITYALLIFMSNGRGATFDFLNNPPAGLEPGDDFRVMFVTDTGIQGNSSNINTYNQFATQEANENAILSSLETTWKAVVSTATVSAHNNTVTNPSNGAHLSVPIYRTDGLSLIAADNSRLWGGLDASVSFDQNGDYFGSAVWSGTFNNGFRRNQFSREGNDNVLGAAFPNIGFSGNSGHGWNDGAVANSGQSLPIYVLSDVIIAPSVPDTNHYSVALAVTISGLFFVGRRNPHR